MGELHLEVYIERIKREYGAVVATGAPQVKYRETITRPVEFEYIHRKQTGGSGQYAKISGRLEPSDDGEFHFENKVIGGNIPSEYIGACQKGFASSVDEGQYIGAPVQGLQVTLLDGGGPCGRLLGHGLQDRLPHGRAQALQRGQAGGARAADAGRLEGPSEHQGDMIKTLMQRRGVIVGTTEDEGFVRIDANVPLAEMFGYASVLRSATAGKAEFTMEFARYAPAPAEVAADLVKKYQDKRAAGR